MVDLDARPARNDQFFWSGTGSFQCPATVSGRSGRRVGSGRVVGAVVHNGGARYSPLFSCGASSTGRILSTGKQINKE